MTRKLLAKYADRRACPICGGPVERLGETWYSNKDNEYYFTPRPICFKAQKEPPKREPHRWTIHKWTEDKTVQTAAGEMTKTITHTRYEYLVEFCCFNDTKHIGGCGAMQEDDTVRYVGPTLDSMLSGEGGNVPKLIEDLKERMAL